MRQKIQELKKDLILDVATEHFDTHGYEATQVSQIAKEAEVSIGTIYSFFQSKEGLFQAHILRELTRSRALVATMLAESELSPQENLKNLLNYYFSHLEKKQKSVQEILLSSPLTMGQFCHQSCEDGSNPMQEMNELIATEIEKLHQVSPLRSTDFLQLSFNFRNLAAAYVERWALLGDIKLAERTNECLELFLKGIIQ